MCGIAGIHVLEDGYASGRGLSKLAAELLEGIAHRGGDATGYATFGPDHRHSQKASCGVREFLTGWRGVSDDARTVLLHTRLATQGKASFPENNHPVVSGDVWVVHNGHINNDSEVFAAYGAARLGYVDSEAIPAAISGKGWDDAGRALETLEGAFAIAAVDVSRPGDLILARGGWSPLFWYSNGRMVVWASEREAVLKAWERAVGTSPDWRNVRMMTEGDLVRWSGQERPTWERFKVKRPPVRVWTWETAALGRPSGYVTPEPVRKLELALNQVAERREGDVIRWDGKDGDDPDVGWSAWKAGDSLDDDVLVDVRCVCCDDWEDPVAMQEVYGELVCADCAAMLLDDEAVLR